MPKLYRFEYDIVGVATVYVVANSYEEALTTAREKKIELRLEPDSIKVLGRDVLIVEDLK